MNGPWSLRIRNWRKRWVALSLTELLCALAILCILAALYLPAIAPAYIRIKKFLAGF